MSNAEYLENFNNLVGITPAFNGQINDKTIVVIVTEGNSREGCFDILDT